MRAGSDSSSHHRCLYVLLDVKEPSATLLISGGRRTCITHAPPAAQLKWNCCATLECAFIPARRSSAIHRTLPLLEIFSFLFALNQLHTEEILMSFIYTHVGVKPARSCWDVKSWSALGALSEIANFHRIRWFYFSFGLFLHSAHERRLENFTPMSPRQLPGLESKHRPDWTLRLALVSLNFLCY